MVLKQMGASLGMKDLEPSLNKNWEKPNSNWLQGKGRLIEMILGIQDTRIRANTEISLTGRKKSEVISSLFLTLTLSLPSSLMILAWQLSSLRLLNLLKESNLPVLGFCIPKAPPSKERSSEISELQCVLWMTQCRSPIQPQISHPGRVMGIYDWLYMIIGPDPAAHMILTFLQNYMPEAGEKQPQG